MSNKLVAALFLLSVCASCHTADQPSSDVRDILSENIDSAVLPAKDFFAYSNGSWVKKNPIPADQASWGIGNLVVEENLRRIRIIIEKAATAHAATGSAEQKIGDFWLTAMDSTKINSAGLQPLQAAFKQIDSIKDLPGFLLTTADFKVSGINTLFDEGVEQDEKASDVMAYNLGQGGLGLPDREYYFKSDAETIHIRAEYVKYMAKMLAMAGTDTVLARKAATNILALETKMAKFSRKIEDLRDPQLNYHKVSYRSLEKMVPVMNWSAYFTHSGLAKCDSVIVGQPEFFTGLNELLKTTPVDDWKMYLKYSTINSYANALPDSFGQAAFQFNRLFTGAKERRPRWKLVIQSEERVMGELLGQLYVKEFFTEKAKKRYEDMGGSDAHGI